MRLKKKGFIVSVLLLLLCCACSNEKHVSVKSWGSSKPTANVRFSAELMSEKTVDVQTPFEIKVGIGNPGIYSAGTLEIHAPGFEITDAGGKTSVDSYICLYEDFKNEIYGYETKDGVFLGLKYFETFQFRYVGEEKTGGISFCISTLQHGEVASEEEQKYGKAAAGGGFFYSVKDGKITLTTERKLDEGSPC